MKKKLLSIILVAAMLTSLVSACGKNDDNKGTESVETEAKESATYEYEQELNIIDDNYRNYYEVFVYSFYDTDGDGIGDLKGVTEKLDYIADMGFNGIWLMPIMPSTTYHKYDVIDYKAVDEQYGTVDDFKELVDEAHKRGINIIIDMVMNHSSSQNQWFKEACKYLQQIGPDGSVDLKECPYVDYYHFSTEQVNSTYYGVPGSGWYYEGSFWDQMPDLNLANEDLKKEFEDIADFWIGLGIDGFRMDATMHFEEGDSSGNAEKMKWIYDYCKSKKDDFYMVSEVWAAENTIAQYYESQTDSLFNFDSSSAEGCLVKAAMGTGSASKVVDKMLEYQETYSAVYADYIDAPFLTNHDQVRVANNLQSNPANLKMAAGLLLTMNGSPFVYYGEEIAMKSKGTKDEDKRLPMYWSETDTSGITKGPTGCDATVKSTLGPVDQQESDPDSLLNYYKRALRIRNENPEIARGQISKIDSLCDGDMAAITKTYENSTIGIVYNTGDQELVVDLTGTDLESMSIRGYLASSVEASVSLEGKKLILPAKSICILK